MYLWLYNILLARHNYSDFHIFSCKQNISLGGLCDISKLILAWNTSNKSQSVRFSTALFFFKGDKIRESTKNILVQKVTLSDVLYCYYFSFPLLFNDFAIFKNVLATLPETWWNILCTLFECTEYTTWVYSVQKVHLPHRALGFVLIHLIYLLLILILNK